MSNLRPTIVMGSLNIHAEQFKARLPAGIRGVAWDLDRTLIGHYQDELPEAHLGLIAGLHFRGLKQAIISNAASEVRTQRVQRIAAGIGTPLDDEVVFVTSRMVGGKRKPLRPIFDEAVSKMNVPAAEICYVGDQLLKDVLGANRAGFGATVLVAPYGSGDDPAVKYLQRPLEAVMRPFVNAPFLTRNF